MKRRRINPSVCPNTDISDIPTSHSRNRPRSSDEMPRLPHHLIITIMALATAPAAIATPAPSSLPQVDFSRMGNVGLGGSFSGLDWYDSNSSGAGSATYSTTSDTVLVQTLTGIRPLGSVNDGGTISALCWANTSSNGTLYVGGHFTTLGGVQSANIGLYDFASASFKSISPGLSGGVEALYCDNAHSQVWVGGAFDSPLSGSGPNVAVYSTASNSWQANPFSGLNGPVDSISPSPNSIYFGGSFTTSYTSNATSTNSSSIPYAPANVTTVGHSGYLTPATLPPMSAAAGNLTVTAGPGSNDSRYNDPRVMLCPGSGSWLAQDGVVSNVDVLGCSAWEAAGVRITNALVEREGYDRLLVRCVQAKSSRRRSS